MTAGSLVFNWIVTTQRWINITLFQAKTEGDRGVNCGDIILFVRWNIMELGTNSWFQLWSVQTANEAVVSRSTISGPVRRSKWVFVKVNYDSISWVRLNLEWPLIVTSRSIYVQGKWRKFELVSIMLFWYWKIRLWTNQHGSSDCLCS